MPNAVRMNADYPKLVESDRWLERAAGLIPAGTQTLAKGAGQYVRGACPTFAVRGQGSHLWDADGNEYLDYQMAIGPLSLGYAYPAVNRAIAAQLEDGITFSLVHPLEVEVAERIHEVIPGAESVRYSKTGADVTSAAVRLARAFTGKSRVLCCGYHGWHDWYIGVTDRNRGVPAAVQDLSFTFDYNDFEALAEAVDDDTACVILEPTVFQPPKNGFLAELRELCTRRGVILVFDEMWTGFRLAVGGAQQVFDVKADLACFSKAVANGMPLSILTGRRDVMRLLEREVFFFTTFGGEALSLAAAKATIHEMQTRPVHAHLFGQGKKLKDGYNAIARGLGIDYTACTGFDCRTVVTFDARAGDPLEMKSLVQQELAKRGILWGGFHNLSYSHSESDIDHTLDAYREVLPILARAVGEKRVRSMLRGAPVEPVFRRTSHFNTKPVRTR